MSRDSLNLGTAKAAMFLSVAGLAWLLWGIAVGFPAQHLMLVMAAGLGVALIIAARRAARSTQVAVEPSPPSESAVESQRKFKRINLAQWASIICVASGLALTGHQDLAVPAVVAIVGLHFIPLGFLYRYKPHFVSAAALIAVACASPLLSAYAPHQAVVGIGAGVILLTSAAYALARASRKNG